MSIPKEPRQLMINLMYLVLTAMLALNVSAEIINAFFALEKGINNSSNIVEAANVSTSESLADWVAKNPKYAEWNTKAKGATAAAKEFEAYVDGLHELLTKEAGGPNPDHPDRPLHYKDKDVTTRLFVDEKRGEELEKKITEARAKLLTFVEPADQKDFGAKLPLIVDEIPHDAAEAGVKTWAELKFRQMPVAAVMPTFAKIRNDSKVSTSAIVNYCLDKASGKKEIKLDKFIVAIAPRKAYLISGRDKFEADIVMGAYSSTANNIRITTSAGAAPMKDGIAHYSGGVESGTGEKTFSASASITNPSTGEVTSAKADFKYEVGQGGFGTVSADKMNVFYIGVDNPISIVAAGVSTSKLQVGASGAGASMTGGGKSRVVRVTSPGDCKITISGGDEMAATSFPFRVKRIPDPIAKLGKDVSGNLGAGSFKVQTGIMAVLENFDFEARCEIQSFELTRQPKREDPITKTNNGGKYDGQSAAMVNAAKPGDIFYFDNVKARCPGDVAGRKINPMVFKIQ